MSLKETLETLAAVVAIIGGISSAIAVLVKLDRSKKAHSAPLRQQTQQPQKRPRACSLAAVSSSTALTSSERVLLELLIECRVVPDQSCEPCHPSELTITNKRVRCVMPEPSEYSLSKCKGFELTKRDLKFAKIQTTVIDWTGPWGFGWYDKPFQAVTINTVNLEIIIKCESSIQQQTVLNALGSIE